MKKLIRSIIEKVRNKFKKKYSSAIAIRRQKGTDVIIADGRK